MMVMHTGQSTKRRLKRRSGDSCMYWHKVESAPAHPTSYTTTHSVRKVPCNSLFAPHNAFITDAPQHTLGTSPYLATGMPSAQAMSMSASAASNCPARLSTSMARSVYHLAANAK